MVLEWGEDAPKPPPPRDAGGPICHPHHTFNLYSTTFEFPALFAFGAWGISTHHCHTKILFSPFPPRQNPCHAIPATPKSFSCRPHYTITLYSIKFEFPALFAHIAWGVSTLPRHAKIRFLPFPPRQNTCHAIPAAPKSYSCFPITPVHCIVSNLNFPPFLHTLPGASLLFPGTPKSGFALPAMPKHLSRHPRHAKIL